MSPRLSKPVRVRLAVALCAAAGLVGGGFAVLPASAAEDAWVLEYRSGTRSSSVNHAEPWVHLENNGDTAAALKDVTVRYYFKADSPQADYRFACSWAKADCANITGTFGRLANPTANADRYLEIGFTEAAGTLQPGGNTQVEVRFSRTDRSTVRQSDDYSFGRHRDFRNWDRITVHRGESLVWGKAPDGTSPQPAPSSPTASPEQSRPPVDSPSPGEPSASPSQQPQQPESPAAEPKAPVNNGPMLFDDFDYSGHDDPRLSQRGWWVRNTTGAPGVPGASWKPENVTFATSDGNSVLNLAAKTDGTPSGTSHAELAHQTKFHKGTYAARVFFSDAPRSGPDGDELVQAFFAITGMEEAERETYGETDFEYLPNGGWGTSTHSMWTTSWENYRPGGQPHNISDKDVASYAGWHDLVLTIDDTAITYYIDGKQFARHTEPFLPEIPMAIDFNQWFMEGGLSGERTPRTYDQKVDYVFYAKDQVLTGEQVKTQVSAYRSDGVKHVDTVPGG